MVTALEIVGIPALADNYVWLVHDGDSGETVVVDPAVSEPVLEAAAARGWRIGQVWNTHWHPDHTGGNAAIKAVVEAAGGGCTISGPAAEAGRIPTLDVFLREGDETRIGDHAAAVIETPGHTAGHIVFHLAGAGVAFTGDTLFAMGCGRLFEGSAEQMHANMERLARLPDETSVYCGHEYTLSNARFAAAVDPGDAAVADRLREVEALRSRGEPTVPTTIGLERATNPFMRAPDAAAFAALRAGKDHFKG